MTNPSPSSNKPVAVVEIGERDMPAPGVVHCPNPRMPLWSTHPRVFIEVAKTGQGKCPYCGTVYQLAAGVAVKGH